MIFMPSDHGGFGFPPSRISALGLLMTNPGHIDPGYRGRLQFTVINMGREDYSLRIKDQIVTLLIFRLSSKVERDFAARNPDLPGSTISQRAINRLSPDFVNVSKRAKKIAQRTLTWASIFAGTGAIILGGLFTWAAHYFEGINQINERLTHIQDSEDTLNRDLIDAKERLKDQISLDHRLSVLESQSKTGAKR
jgi:dCTP deaminase